MRAAGSDGILRAVLHRRRLVAFAAVALITLLNASVAAADAGTVSVSPLASTSPAQSLVVGPDGNVWFTEAASMIGRLNQDGTVNEFTVPAPQCCGAGLGRIIVGPDNNLWFEGSTPYEGTIGTSTTDGTITMFLPRGQPGDIAAGPDGSVWYTETGEFSSVNAVVKMTTGGTITEFPLSGSQQPNGITAGPDGNVWFTEVAGNNIGRISPKGHLKEFALPRRGAEPMHIVTGPDGNLWFTEYGVDAIGRMTPSGRFKEFLLPVNTFPNWIAVGPDGNLWFTGSRVVGRITTKGVATIFTAAPPADGSCQFGTIVPGPDGRMWTPTPCTTGIVQVTTS